MHGRPNVNEWKPIDFDDEYAAGMAHQRFVWLAEYDPFVGMFSRETINSLGNLFFSDVCLGNERIYALSMQAIDVHVRHALGASPMSRMLNDHFVDHIVRIVQRAVLAGKDNNG